MRKVSKIKCNLLKDKTHVSVVFATNLKIPILSLSSRSFTHIVAQNAGKSYRASELLAEIRYIEQKILFFLVLAKKLNMQMMDCVKCVLKQTSFK